MPYLYSTLWINGQTVTDLWADAESPIKTMWVADEKGRIKKVWDKYLKIGIEEIEYPLAFISAICYAEDKLLILGTKEDPDEIYNQKATICFLDTTQDEPEWIIKDSYFLHGDYDRYHICYDSGYFYFNEGIVPTGYVTTPDTNQSLITRTADGVNFESFQPQVWDNRSANYTSLGFAGLGKFTVANNCIVLSLYRLNDTRLNNWNAAELPSTFSTFIYFDHYDKNAKVEGDLKEFKDKYYMQTAGALLVTDGEHILDYSDYQTATTYDSFYDGFTIEQNGRLMVNELSGHSAAQLRYLQYSTDGESFTDIDLSEIGVNIQRVGYMHVVGDCILMYLREYVVDDVTYQRVLLVINKDGERQAWTQIPDEYYLQWQKYNDTFGAFAGNGLTKYAIGYKIVDRRYKYGLLKITF